MEIYDASLHACMREPASLFAGIEGSGESEKRKRMLFGGLILQLVALLKLRIFVKLMKLSALALVILTSYNLAGSSSCHDGLDDGCLWCFSLESQTYLQPDTQVPKSKTEAVLVIPLKSRHSRPSCRGHRPSALWPVACAGREGGRPRKRRALKRAAASSFPPSGRRLRGPLWTSNSLLHACSLANGERPSCCSHPGRGEAETNIFGVAE